MKSLSSLREDVQKTDQKILKLLAKRFRLVKKVALYKKKHDILIEDPIREQNLLTFWLETAKNEHLDERLTKKLLLLLLKHSRKLQLKECKQAKSVNKIKSIEI